MKNKNELNYKQLKVICDPNIFQFETTENLDPITTGIGQDRGIRALEFGINVNIKGYNIYIEGPSRCRENHVYQKLFKKNSTEKESTTRLVLYL